MNKIEIMAPAGSFASMSAAINAGCNSIYFGVEQLNMRARASHNFSVDDLPEIAKKAKEAGVRSYIAMNTLMYEHDMNLMKNIISAAKDAGIDAVIVADMAAMQYAYEIAMPIQASTQLSISNYSAVKFYAQFVDTVVLAREVDLRMMKKICDKIKEEDLRGPAGELIKVEVFVHGALCIAQSGRCQMSLLQNNTSAQRGACLQECRHKYKVIDDETGKEMQVRDGYVFSPRDLCCIDFLDKIIEAGVSILKIEGRGRSPHYVDIAVRCYREAADSIANGTYSKEKIKHWKSELEKVFNRGFTDGYYLGKKLPDWSEASGNQSKEERTFIGLVNHYFRKPKIAEINLQAHPIKLGDNIVIMGNTTGIEYNKVTSIVRDKKSLEKADNPDMVTIPVNNRVRKNDKVYLVTKRNLNEKT